MFFRKFGLGVVYGNILNSFIDWDIRKLLYEVKLILGDNFIFFIKECFVIYNLYFKYNLKEWLVIYVLYVFCIGVMGDEVEDIKVFRGCLCNFFDFGFGSYSMFGFDCNFCFEREIWMG